MDSDVIEQVHPIFTWAKSRHLGQWLTETMKQSHSKNLA
jgi:hypothetical protein